jgi:hypothetical protein
MVRLPGRTWRQAARLRNDAGGERMDEKETLQSIAVCFQKKYNGFVEMESITKQLQDALNYDDVVTIRMLVRMRQQEIDNIDMTDRQWAEIADKLSKAQQDALKKGDDSLFAPENAPLVRRIGEIVQNSHRLLGRLIEEDKKVNRKLAGDKTFYKD